VSVVSSTITASTVGPGHKTDIQTVADDCSDDVCVVFTVLVTPATMLRDLRAYCYIWAVMHDPRIRLNDW
jgi:hypothetical protein